MKRIFEKKQNIYVYKYTITISSKTESTFRMKTRGSPELSQARVLCTHNIYIQYECLYVLKMGINVITKVFWALVNHD